MTKKVVIAIDQGTTNSKAILLSSTGEILASGSSPTQTDHPQSGWVEQHADQIWSATLAAIKTCLGNVPDADVVAIGISNQRESILAWDKKTGEALGPVITWQCRRTADACQTLKAQGYEDEVISKTGLPIDPLFPATKAHWILKNQCVGKPTEDICIGTVDSWLLWKLTGGKVHATDFSNAARTQLFNIDKGEWDEGLCKIFDVPMEILPSVYDSSNQFGVTAGIEGLSDGIPVASAIGDSHAALFGHGAYNSGDGKITFGTGSSVMTTIPKFIVPPKGVTTTIAWSLNGKPTYAFEGNILVSASILPWATKLLGLADVAELVELAKTVEDSYGVTLVPAHVGLGSPHWDAEARGLICGLSFNAGPAHIARAAAESMALQVQDIFEIIEPNTDNGIGRLFVDGGPSKNPFLMALVAGYLDHPVRVCENAEASAVGAAYLAGLAVGLWSGLEEVQNLGGQSTPLAPDMTPDVRETAIKEWKTALKRTMLK